MTDDRLPTSLFVEAHLRTLDSEAVPYYIVQKGAEMSGTILLKINALGEGCRLLVQQRDIMTGELGWMNALDDEEVEETQADEYIRRAVARDPDLWVIEIEDRAKRNPFEGKMI